MVEREILINFLQEYVRWYTFTTKSRYLRQNAEMLKFSDAVAQLEVTIITSKFSHGKRKN